MCVKLCVFKNKIFFISSYNKDDVDYHDDDADVLK